MKPLILPLKEIKERDREIVGAKAFRLSQLLLNGLTVPQAFVLTTQAFDLFFEENNLLYLIERLATEDERHMLEDIYRDLKRKIKNGRLSQNLVKEINEKINQYRFRSLAVRSSATAEDLELASFAGQFESYLNITSQRVFDFIKTCWSSLYEERVLSYSLYHGIPMHEIKMAVLIQEMINAEKGGVIFTKDVLRHNERVIIIEVAKGLGTGVVAGTAELDRYVVEKTDLKTISQKLRGPKPILKQDEIFELASLGLLIENFYRSPQDIEWAAAGGKVYLLQTRPITT